VADSGPKLGVLPLRSSLSQCPGQMAWHQLASPAAPAGTPHRMGTPETPDATRIPNKAPKSSPSTQKRQPSIPGGPTSPAVPRLTHALTSAAAGRKVSVAQRPGAEPGAAAPKSCPCSPSPAPRAASPGTQRG